MSLENPVQAKERSPRAVKSFAVMFLTVILLIGASTAVFAGKSTLGDYVWIDYNRNDLPDDGPTGINGVVVHVYKDDGNGIFSPTIDSLVAISTTINEPLNADGDNTNPGERGFYDTSVNDGDHWVHLPASNFGPGGALEGYTYTGSGQVLPDGSVILLRNVPIQGNINTADFGFVPVDWGDLPDNDSPAGSPNSPGYNTDSTGVAGASHVIVSGLHIGASEDAETNGQPNATATGDDIARTPNDESGVTLPPAFVVGKTASFTVTVVNTTGVPAILYGFVDWNGDGDFLDAVEKLTVTIPSNAGGTIATLNYGVPATALLTEQVGARFRLSTDATLGADGAAPNGEVEDYLIRVTGYDWGDLPDGNATTSPNYSTDSTGANIGPSHLITTSLRLGAGIDAEGDGQPTATADGDDTLTSDDENGVAAFPQFVAGSSTVITFTALNNTGAVATLYGFIDWNADGDFGDTGEQVTVAVPNGTNGNIALNVTVPLTASTTSDLGARFRLSTDSGLGAYGPASNGEVEDYLIRVQRFDLALRKVKSAPAGGVLPGGLITFTLTISNQGTIAARDLVVTDYITAGFTFTPNNGWTGSGTQISTTIAGPLAAGTSTTTILVLRVATNYYGSQLTNFAEISSADDDGNPATPPPTDVDSTPDNNPNNDGTPKNDVTNENHKDNPTDDEDDHDPAVVPVAQIRDLAILKTTNVVDVRPGDLVTFTIVITNEGTAPASNIQVTDTFTNAFQVPVGNALNTANGWTGTASPLVTTVAGPLNPGATTTLQIVLRVDPAYRGSQLTNTASVPPDDNPPGEPPDDEDPEEVPVKYFDLALVKRSTPNNTVEPGKTVTFTIEIYNQGTLPAYNIQVSDYITSAFVFTPAVALNNGWSAASASLLNKTIVGPLAVGAMTTTQLVLQVPSSFAQTTLITNTAEISAADDDTNPNDAPPTDVDSTPDNNPTNDGPVTDNVVNNTNGDQDDHDPAPVLVTYNPTAVQIAKSDVKKVAGGMEVNWATESESDLAGFNLYRLIDGKLQKVNGSMISAQKPGQADGASYQLIDTAASGQSTSYVLEIVSSDGSVGYVYLGSNAQVVKIFAPVILAKR